MHDWNYISEDESKGTQTPDATENPLVQVLRRFHLNVFSKAAEYRHHCPRNNLSFVRSNIPLVTAKNLHSFFHSFAFIVVKRNVIAMPTISDYR